MRHEQNENSVIADHNGGMAGSEILDSDRTLYLELGKMNPVTGKVELPPYNYESKLFKCRWWIY